MILSRFVPTFALVALATVAVAAPASAASRHHRLAEGRSVATATGSVSYAHHGRYSGYHALVSDGPGSGYGFHRLPGGLRFAGQVGRQRQRDAVHSAVVDDAVDSANPYGFGFYGDSVYGYGNGADYGVYSGADGYGSPYFAGFYGPGDGADLGPLGHAYAN